MVKKRMSKNPKKDFLTKKAVSAYEALAEYIASVTKKKPKLSTTIKKQDAPDKVSKKVMKRKKIQTRKEQP